jgi:hypothetical protein
MKSGDSGVECVGKEEMAPGGRIGRKKNQHLAKIFLLVSYDIICCVNEFSLTVRNTIKGGLFWFSVL